MIISPAEVGVKAMLVGIVVECKYWGRKQNPPSK